MFENYSFDYRQLTFREGSAKWNSRYPPCLAANQRREVAG